MLQQILKDGHIDPNLLAELDEEQKQLLFFKLREEQLRKRKEWESSHSEEQKRAPFKPTKLKKGERRQVGFLTAADGKPWTWVMGEHENDRSVEDILKEEALTRALKLAELEICEEIGVSSSVVNPGIIPPSDTLQPEPIIQPVPIPPVPALPESTEAEPTRPESNQPIKAEEQMPQKNSEKSADVIKPSTGSDAGPVFISLFRPGSNRYAGRNKTSAEVMAEKAKRRSVEIFQKMMIAHDQMVKSSAEENKEITKAWQEQEVVAKQADTLRRTIARSVRENQHEFLRRVRTESQYLGSTPEPDVSQSGVISSGDGAKKTGGRSRSLRPRSPDDVIRWFHEEEEPRGAGRDPKTGRVAEWFHGLISRENADALLVDRPAGSFLIRLSERIWGYAVSYRCSSGVGAAVTSQRCKHFLIDASAEGGGYQFFGSSHVVHDSLAELVRFHSSTPISFSGQEFLTTPCGQLKGACDYHDLLSDPPKSKSSVVATVSCSTSFSGGVAAAPSKGVRSTEERSDGQFSHL